MFYALDIRKNLNNLYGVTVKLMYSPLFNCGRSATASRWISQVPLDSYSSLCKHVACVERLVPGTPCHVGHGSTCPLGFFGKGPKAPKNYSHTDKFYPFPPNKNIHVHFLSFWGLMGLLGYLMSTVYLDVFSVWFLNVMFLWDGWNVFRFLGQVYLSTEKKWIPDSFFGKLNWLRSRGTTKRRYFRVSGDKKLKSILDANRVARRVAYMLEYHYAKGVYYILENPISSILWKFRCICRCLERHHAKRVVVHLGGYGACTLKPVSLLVAGIFRFWANLYMVSFPHPKKTEGKWFLIRVIY